MSPPRYYLFLNLQSLKKVKGKLTAFIPKTRLRLNMQQKGIGAEDVCGKYIRRTKEEMGWEELVKELEE